MLASVLQLVLVEDHVEHVRRTLRQLLRCHHLHRQVLALTLATGLDQPLENLQYHRETQRLKRESMILISERNQQLLDDVIVEVTHWTMSLLK